MLTLKHVKMLKIPIKQHIFCVVALLGGTKQSYQQRHCNFSFCLAYYQAAFLSITNSSLVYMYRKCDPSLCYVSPQQEQEIYIFFMLKVKYIIYILNTDVAEKNYLLCKDIVE